MVNAFKLLWKTIEVLEIGIKIDWKSISEFKNKNFELMKVLEAKNCFIVLDKTTKEFVSYKLEEMKLWKAIVYTLTEIKREKTKI